MDGYSKEAPETIQALFGSIAKDYDRTNALLSFQLHRYWNRRLVKTTLACKPTTESSRYADLCCGTGAIGYDWLKFAKTPQTAYFIDFCEGMLACARSKINKQTNSPHQLHFIQADVQQLPLASESIDCMTMAYGIRNVKNPAVCFKDTHRVLAPGGVFGILELTEPNSTLLRFAHQLYLKNFLPWMGKLATSNRSAYEYLSQSIGAFSKPDEISLLLKDTGFSAVTITPLTGGIATLITAIK